ncbi:hypothetical protein L7F22_002890 [Adiantum nelumboides]|nr:hypothetical protein [Adiantum nelumboides]
MSSLDDAYISETVAAMGPNTDTAQVEDVLCEEGQPKRPKCFDVAPFEAATMDVTISHEANQPLSAVGISLTSNAVQEDWGHLLEFANSLLQEYAEHNQSKAVDIPDEDVLEVSMDTPRVLQLLSAFHEKAVVFFFTGRLPPMHFIRNWLNSFEVRCGG